MNIDDEIEYVNNLINNVNKNLDNPRSFEYFINKIWVEQEDYWKRDEFVLYKEYIDKLDRKDNKLLYAGWSFITLSPDHNLRNIEYSEYNIYRLKEFCNSWFNETNYSGWKWVIESGKHKDKPHLHLHSFCRIKNPRHHKRDLCCMWKKFFPALEGDDYHIIKCNTKDMFIDKQNYLENDRKGTHMNFEDLSLPPFNAMGSGGVITSK